MSAPTVRRRSQRRRTARRLAHALAAAALTVAAGCGGEAPPGPTGPADPSASAVDAVAADEASWARAVMAERYLYADRMPATGASGATTAAEVLEALRVDPPDRFSYVERRTRQEAFFQEGRTVGLGIGYRVEGQAVMIRMVQPESPAGRAGLQRGDRLLAIDGKDTAQLVALGTLSEAFGAAEAGVSVRLTLARRGQAFERTVVKEAYPVSPLLAQRVIEYAGEPVGYVALYTFAEPTRAQWAQALGELRSAGVRRLVVDLRDNGGGRLAVAAEVAARLAPPSAAGQPFVLLQHAPARARDDRALLLPVDAVTGSFEEVAWLVSDLSCSAAEALIAGLRPYRDDPVIGSATCGKPVGFEPQTRGEVVLNAVTFAMLNRDGLTDWFAGLSPTCTVTEEPYLALGDPADPRLAEALHRLATGRCSARDDKSARTRDPRPPRVPGLAGMTGLW
jgi:carboxyl-terminal processing protease